MYIVARNFEQYLSILSRHVLMQLFSSLVHLFIIWLDTTGFSDLLVSYSIYFFLPTI